MKELIKKLKKTKAKAPTALATATHANQGLMGISALKQMCQIKGFKIPSMSCTHYIAFRGDVRGRLEWLLSCNFLPLCYTGFMTNAKYHTKANYWLDNLSDTIDNESGRYKFTLYDLEDAVKYITPDTTTPHVILDFRGFGNNMFPYMAEITKWAKEVVAEVAENQKKLLTFGDKWTLEHDHNPIITVLTDYCDSHNMNLCPDEYVFLHTLQVKEVYESCPLDNTHCESYVWKPNTKALANG